MCRVRVRGVCITTDGDGKTGCSQKRQLLRQQHYPQQQYTQHQQHHNHQHSTCHVPIPHAWFLDHYMHDRRQTRAAAVASGQLATRSQQSADHTRRVLTGCLCFSLLSGHGGTTRARRLLRRHHYRSCLLQVLVVVAVTVAATVMAATPIMTAGASVFCLFLFLFLIPAGRIPW